MEFQRLKLQAVDWAAAWACPVVLTHSLGVEGSVLNSMVRADCRVEMRAVSSISPQHPSDGAKRAVRSLGLGVPFAL